jgi:hypothetical protein
MKDILKRVYTFLVTIDSEPQAEQVETVPLEEYNKTKQALEEANNNIITLTKTNEDIINKNEITNAEVEKLESDIRVLKIKSILDATTLTDAEKEEQLQVLPRSSLSIDFIQSTYERITKTKKNNINRIVETKLPQKSIIEKNKDFSYVK